MSVYMLIINLTSKSYILILSLVRLPYHILFYCNLVVFFLQGDFFFLVYITQHPNFFFLEPIIIGFSNLMQLFSLKRKRRFNATLLIKKKEKKEILVNYNLNLIV